MAIPYTVDFVVGSVNRGGNTLKTAQLQDVDVIQLGKDTIQSEANEVLSLLDRVDDRFVRAVELMSACKGRVIVTGMGKSGIIGRKISASLASTGTPSLSLHPAEALHGDLGMVQPADVVLAISNSGETEEITRLLPTIKKIGAKLISMVGKVDSTLAKYSDVVLDVSITREACLLGLAPTSSTTVTLVLGDALTICVYKKKGFKVEDFAFFHPAGSLGRQLLKVEDIMRTDTHNPVVSKDVTVKDTLIAVTRAHAGAASVVDDDGMLIGFFTDGDFRRAVELYEDVLKQPVHLFMTKNPLTIKPDCLATEALKIIKEKRIDEMPVVDASGKPVGMIDEGDLLGL